MASFLIIKKSTEFHLGCSDPSQILLTAWKMNLLHAKFICNHTSKGLLIYSYNPYINQAPISWQLEKSYRIENKHPWTLLVRSYQDNRDICKDLDFDQTKDLGGYLIRVGMVSSKIKKSLKTNLENLNGSSRTIGSYIFRALNSTTELYERGDVRDLRDITHGGVTDIALASGINRQNYSISPMTYPLIRLELAVITQSRGNLSQVEKLFRVIDHHSRYAVVFVCCIIFVFFKFFLKQSVTTAMLTIVRFICNAAVPNLPNNLPTRIYLTGLFIFIITLQGIYQGQLASLLTKPVALPNVKTYEDLENYKYTIYGHDEMIFYFKKLNYSGPLVPLARYTCWRFVLGNNAAACVRDRHRLIEIANKYDLQLSDTIIHNFYSFHIRKDWPLEEKFNLLLSRLIESNIIEYVFMKGSESSLRKRKFYEKGKENPGFTVITLKDMAFAFATLGIGLAIATVVFFVEVWTRRK